jgi:hypothetical protein
MGPGSGEKCRHHSYRQPPTAGKGQILDSIHRSKSLILKFDEKFSTAGMTRSRQFCTKGPSFPQDFGPSGLKADLLYCYSSLQLQTHSGNPFTHYLPRVVAGILSQQDGFARR